MKRDILQAVDILRKGGLVAIPTETVYGLGADARNPEALQKIFAAKGRPMDHPLIVHVGALSQITDWAVVVSQEALLLANAFWPGPLTLILKKAPTVSDWITGNQETIGLRIPNHPQALALLQAFGEGVAAPSANRYGRISPTSAEAVREELGDAVDFILEGGICAVGVESTIIDMTGSDPILLRPGMITVPHIEAVMGRPVLFRQKESPRVSGSMESHYAPVTPTRLIATKDIPVFLQQTTLTSALLVRKKPEISAENVQIKLMPHEAQQYAHALYQTLRQLDKEMLHTIVIETVPEGSEWDAIRDRLQRAAHL